MMFDYDELFPAVLLAMFPEPQIRRQVEANLSLYGAASSDHEPRRVWLAVLKLAGRDLDAINRNVGYALTDYRDVLAWAEYPEAMRSESWRLAAASPEKERINQADRRQYQQWLNSLLPEGETDHGP